MDSQSRILWGSAGALALLVAILLLQPAIREELAPEPKISWVAIEVADGGVAEVGPVEIETGTPWSLHAVLEAEDSQGRPVYYTQAGRLSFQGQEVPPDRLRRWDRPPTVKVRWFTVEGVAPFLQLSPGEGLERLGVEAFYRSEWPQTWTVPGELDPAHDDQLVRQRPDSRRDFGALRFQVRIEIYGPRLEMVPQRTIASWGPAELPVEAERFPGVVVRLPGTLGPASAVFGLTEIEPPEDAPPELLRDLRRLADLHVVFSRLTVLSDQIRGAGASLDNLEWVAVDLSAGPSWGAAIDRGDLVRAGSRVAVMYEDRGEAERLDDEDLCFDFVRGAEVRRLGDIFSGDGEVLEVARLARSSVASGAAGGGSG